MGREFRNLSRRNYELKRDELAAAKRSLYFWWWKFLRLSPDYWWLCQQKGKTRDKEFAKTYRDFGDVFDVYGDFDLWWGAHGEGLFAYQLSPPKVNFYDDNEITLRRRRRWYYLVMVPKFFTKTEVLKQLDTLFDRFQPEAFPEELSSRRSMASLQGIRKPVLIEAFKVWCLNAAIQRGKADGSLQQPQRYTQFWIGKTLGLREADGRVKRYDKRKEDCENLAMRVKVNRYLSKVHALIRNVEVGIFPSVRMPEPRRYWTLQQERDLQKAIKDGLWLSPEAASEEITCRFGS